MTQWHLKSKKKVSGGIRRSLDRCNKKLSWRGSEFAATTVMAERKETDAQPGRGKKRKGNIRKIVTGRGTVKKKVLKQAKFANLMDSASKKVARVEILAVQENDANRQYARRNIMTKGAIIKVKVNGHERLAKITSRPGQAGTINAVLIKEKTVQKPEPKPVKEVEKPEKALETAENTESEG